MASIDVGIHPDPSGITSKHFPGGSPASFSTLEITVKESHVAVFVDKRPVLDALQRALNAIRDDFNAAESAAIQDASDQVPTEMADWPAGDELELQHAYGYL